MPIHRMPVQGLVLRSVHDNIAARGFHRLPCRHRVQLALRFRVVVIVSAQAHLTRVGTLSGPGSRLYPVSYPGPSAEGPIILSRFPAAFRPPAFASRVIPSPPRLSAFLTVGLPDQPSGPDPVGVTTFHTIEMRPGWVPPLPRGRRCSPGEATSFAGACRFPTASPCTPLEHPIGGAHNNEASIRGSCPSPVRSSPRL